MIKLLGRVGIGVVSVVIGLALFSYFSRSRRSPVEGGAGFSMPRPVRLGSSEIVVPPGRFSYTRFDVPASNEFWVAGHYRATGGAGNDIQVMLMDADSFANFKNRHTFKTYYSSPKETAGTLAVGKLPAGTYYLIFSNLFSIFSNKVVQNGIQLQATPPR
jgi:hypothetical protein